MGSARPDFCQVSFSGFANKQKRDRNNAGFPLTDLLQIDILHVVVVQDGRGFCCTCCTCVRDSMFQIPRPEGDNCAIIGMKSVSSCPVLKLVQYCGEIGTDIDCVLGYPCELLAEVR